MCPLISLEHPIIVGSVARAFIDSVVTHHGHPCVIVTDMDRIFTRTLWRTLFQHCMPFTNTWADGKAKLVPKSQPQKYSIHSTKGVAFSWLSMAEWWYNTSFHTSLKTTLFQALYG
jgi:hypothetical protein